MLALRVPNPLVVPVQDKLLKDPQGRASRPEVPTREQQQLFEKHIQDLRASLDVEFRQLLDQVWTVKSALCRLDPQASEVPIPLSDCLLCCNR